MAQHVADALAKGYAFATETTLEGIRAGYDRCMAADLPPGVSAEPAEVAGVPGTWFRPAGAGTDDVVLFLHGGGYFAGSSRSHGALAAHIADAAGLATFAADYRLAPEHPFPAAVDDAVAVLAALGSSSSGKVFVVGDSAGGGLTMATLLATRDRGLALPAAAATMSAWLDLRLVHPDIDEKAAIDPVVSRAGLEFNTSMYLGGQPATDPLASPLLGDPTGLPPLHMQVGTEEVLHQDTVQFADKVRAAGGEVTVEIEDGMPHVHQILIADLPEAKDSVGRIGKFLRAHS
ncbi:alpha/beta hydrolase [Nakamurella alba]|uniref:alpha/beta hydrolase n=1 Tax=Nakamurella alba TaxID=2665158 RepID=UPI0018A95FC0|nr:alpha/beta hydrolase [Nakamurella alba]